MSVVAKMCPGNSTDLRVNPSELAFRGVFFFFDRLVIRKVGHQISLLRVLSLAVFAFAMWKIFMRFFSGEVQYEWRVITYGNGTLYFIGEFV